MTEQAKCAFLSFIRESRKYFMHDKFGYYEGDNGKIDRPCHSDKKDYSDLFLRNMKNAAELFMFENGNNGFNEVHQELADKWFSK